MRSKIAGKNISEVEISNISKNGVWIIIKESEYFMPCDEYPWFKDAKINDILNVSLLHETHLYWPNLDVDLDIKSIKNLEKYPLVYK